MSRAWTPEEIDELCRARELPITTRLPGGALGPWVPIWVVCVGTDVYVRTWYRRDTGWWGRAVRTGQARIRIRDTELDVDVDEIGSSRRLDVDQAYRAKYPAGGHRSMTADTATATTLRLRPPGLLTPSPEDGAAGQGGH